MSVEGRTNKAPALFFYHADVKIAVFLSIFAMTIIFRFPQNRPCKAVWGIFFVSYAKIQKIYDTGNQIVKFV